MSAGQNKRAAGVKQALRAEAAQNSLSAHPSRTPQALAAARGESQPPVPHVPTLSGALDVCQRKAALRRTMRAARAAVSFTARMVTSAQICAHLAALPAYKAAKTVFCFVGMAQEIDTHAFLQTVLNDGKILCTPFCVPAQKGVMHAKRVTTLLALQPDAFGIDAPPACAQTVLPQTIDFAVLPCVAADKTGLRLGYGGGYYDRYLPQLLPVCTSVVLCRTALLLPPGTIPAQPYDARAQWVLTEEGLL